MKRKVTFAILLAIALIACHSTIHSAKKPPKRTSYNPIIHKIVEYSMPEAKIREITSDGSISVEHSLSLGRSASSLSPGTTIGNTYYDYQHNNTTGRMVGVGQTIDGSDTSVFIHFTWMDLVGIDISTGRGPGYNYAGVSSGVTTGEYLLTTLPELAGYVNLDVTPDNQAVISGHYDPQGYTDSWAPTVWYDSAPTAGNFVYVTSIPEPLWQWANPYAGDEAPTIWPHMAFQQKPDGSHVTHLTGVTIANGLGPHALYYYRKHGDSSDLSLGGLSSCGMLGDPVWDCPWVYDTAWASVALVTASKNSGKVALTWTANRPDYDLTPGCDTCSADDYGSVFLNRNDNDVYYQISDDYGLSWNPRVNVTQNEYNVDWMPYNDITAVFTGDAPSEELHIAWVATDWERYLTEGISSYAARIYHWAETFGVGYDKARVAATSIFDPIQCNAGAFNYNLSKPQISECNGNIYILYVDLWDGHDDPLNPDCSERGYSGDPTGAANGELAVVISDNNGLSFDLPHNLTQTPTPMCDSIGAILSCESDHWPSMAPHGFAVTTSDASINGVKVNPRPEVNYQDMPGSYWLPVMYINDKDPGFVINDNSTWQNNPVNSFYMACIEPDYAANPWGLCWGYYDDIGWPLFAPPGVQVDVERVLENTGNADLNYTIIVEEISGPSGWLTVSGFDGFIPHGFNNLDTGLIHLNTGGIITSTTGYVAQGRIILEEIGSGKPCTLDVVLPIIGGIGDRVWDTVSTGVMSIAVSNTGQFGGGTDIAADGGAKMDFFNDPAECDTVDSIPGETETYIYDGSIVVGGIVGNDTIFACQIYSQGFRNDWSIYPLEPAQNPTIDGILQTWNSGTMVNYDSSIAMEVTYFAPQTTGVWGSGPNTWYLDQQFITRELKVWSANGQPHTGLAIGEAVDWDIPSDSGSDNSGEVDASRRLAYCIGGEYNQDGAVECQDNNERYGGQAFGYFKIFNDSINSWSIVDSIGFGSYIESSARYVYPGWNAGELYVNMEFSGVWTGWIPPVPESAQIDLHSVQTYAFDFDLKPEDTIVFYSVLATVRNATEEGGAGPARIQDLADKGRKFTKYFGCCHGIKGDANGDGTEANILDLNFMVNRIFRGGPAPTCLGEGDANNDGTPANILDLNFLVNRVFRGGPAPATCGTPPGS